MILTYALAALARYGPRRGESAQTLVEYSLIIGLVAVAAVAGLSLMAQDVDSLWGNIDKQVAAAISSVLGSP